MGGTFDPIHVGHLILGEKAYEQLGLDKILFMPAGNPPHKRNRKGRASDEQRVEMVNLAIQGNPHFELSLIEMNAEDLPIPIVLWRPLRNRIRIRIITLL